MDWSLWSIRKKKYSPNKKIGIKKSILRSDLCDFSDANIVVKGNIIVDKKTLAANDFNSPNNTAANAIATNTENNNVFGEKKLVFKTKLHLSTAFQKLLERKLRTQKI